MDPVYFPTPARWRAWLTRHHAAESELWVGFHRKATGTPSLTWPEAVDEALCFGWIDGVRRRVDETRYVIRFTPRRAGSTWSRVNIARAEALLAAGRMRAAGRKAFAARTAPRSGTYSYENRASAVLAPEDERRFRRHVAAWRFFEGQAPGYRRTVTWWVTSAKRAETRARRLDRLIEACAAGRAIPPLRTRPVPPRPRA